MMKNDSLISSINTMETIIEHYLNGKLETEIADLLHITTTEVIYILNDKNIIQDMIGNHKWGKLIRKRTSNSQKLYYALSTMRQNPFSIRYEQLVHIMNSFRLSHMDAKEYCKKYDLPEDIFTSFQENFMKFGNGNYFTIWNKIQANIPINKAIEQRVNMTFADTCKSLEQDFERKVALLQETIQSGDIRPYWVCGVLAIHNFSYKEVSKNTGISEIELEFANKTYMETLCTDINGHIIPYDCSFQILQYASGLKPKEKCKKKA